jgi:hypothetical protein
MTSSNDICRFYIATRTCDIRLTNQRLAREGNVISPGIAHEGLTFTSTAPQPIPGAGAPLTQEAGVRASSLQPF